MNMIRFDGYKLRFVQCPDDPGNPILETAELKLLPICYIVILTCTLLLETIMGLSGQFFFKLNSSSQLELLPFCSDVLPLSLCGSQFVRN